MHMVPSLLLRPPPKKGKKESVNYYFLFLPNPGKYFYELDEKSVRPGYPKLIKEVWGIEGPIDAAFTRINCEGKTYIFKVGSLPLPTFSSHITSDQSAKSELPSGVKLLHLLVLETNHVLSLG